MTRFDPSTYPGRRPVGPMLVYGGREWRLELTGDADDPFTADDVAAGAPVLTDGPIHWSVAYGANASPDRLVDKVLDTRGAILLPAKMVDHELVWEARRSISTGAVPLTLGRNPNRVERVWLLGLHVEDTPILDASEGRGSRYVLGHVGPVAVSDRWLVADALAYGPGPETRVLGVGGRPLVRHEADQQAAQLALDDHLTVPLGADQLREPVEGAWPVATLADLDLFTYGTLKPGEERWPQIADLVDVVADAETRGTLTATFYGWPAADVGGIGRVRGVLLRPKGRTEAAELYRRADRIEDVPNLFLRRAVRVTTPSGQRWAATFTWNTTQGRPPGTILPDGEWSG